MGQAHTYYHGAVRQTLFPLLIAALAGCARFRPAPPPPPDWLGKTIFTDDQFIYAVGHSQPQDAEKTARRDAVADATEVFLKSCGVDEESFDRSIESYSLDGSGREAEYSRLAGRLERRPRAFARLAPPLSWYSVRDGGQRAASVLLRVPKEEQARIRQEKEMRLSLDFLFYREDEDGKLKPLVEGEILRSGGRFGLYLRPSDESYVYLYETDGSDRTFRLFPNPAFGTESNPLPPGKPAWIPNERRLLALDSTTGKETLTLFASRKRIPELEGGIAALTRTDLRELAAAKKMSAAGLREKRGAGAVVPPQKPARPLADKEKLLAEDAAVYETWFRHR